MENKLVVREEDKKKKKMNGTLEAKRRIELKDHLIPVQLTVQV